jgi:hypothetical protein
MIYCLGSVSSAGDVNGDGLDDLIVGAYQADSSNKSNAGKSYVVFGKQNNNCFVYRIQHTIYLRLIYYLNRLDKHPQLNHLNRRH